MKKLYTSHQPFMVDQMRLILESHHIECVLRNAFLSGAAGELPPIECWPELWVLDPGQFERASELIQAFEEGAETTGAPWACHHCGEQVEGGFGTCWRCGTDRLYWA